MNQTDAGIGLTLFLLGLYKKVLLADQLSSYVAAVYGAAAKGLTLTWFDAWLATLAFALQIYFDFSGYSDMAIGLARLFEIKLPINFDSPYQASSISEFLDTVAYNVDPIFARIPVFSAGWKSARPVETGA